MANVKAILDQNACKTTDGLSPHLKSLISDRQKTLGPCNTLFYQEPLEIVRGEGAWLFDAKGQPYLDAYNNVPILGHSHPAVVDAVSAQLATLNTHTRYLDRQIHAYAEDLLASLELTNARVVFTCSGSEANDLAIRLAQMNTGKQGIIVSRAAYHGNTALTSQVSPSAFRQGSLPDWVETIGLPSAGMKVEDAGLFLATQVSAAIEELEKRSYGCAALLIDTIFSSDGVHADPMGFLAPAVARVHRAGGVLIADEVQPGFGRTGDCFWGFQRHEIEPDIVTMGKPMGNGYPIAAVVAGETLFEPMSRQFGYFNTFGGSNAAIAAAQTVFDVLRTDALQLQAKLNGNQLKNNLLEIAREHPCLGDIRGAGLYWGVDIVKPEHVRWPDPEKAAQIVNAMKQKGVLIGLAGSSGNALKIRPPLCFTADHVEQLCETLAQVLQDLHI